MRYANTQAEEPGLQVCIAIPAAASPRAAVIGQDTVGKAIATKGAFQTGFDRPVLLIGARGKPKGEPRIIIEDRECVAAALVETKVAHEVHLPQDIGCGCFKALEIPLGPYGH